MKYSVQFLLFAFCLFLGNSALSAQEKAETFYVAIDYIKVKAGEHDNYLATEKAWKKIHQANIKAEKYNHWGLERVAYPSGADVPHNYVTRTILRGEKQLADYMTKSIFPENMETILTEAEMNLVENTLSARTLIKSEVYSRGEYLLPENMDRPIVSVFNYFDFPQGGSRQAHVDVEKNFWMPAHQARIDDKKMLGWVLLHRELPYGTGHSYQDATVDLYASMEAFLTNGNPIPYMNKVHPGESLDEIMAKTNAASELIGAEIRVWIDDARNQE